MVQQDKAEAEAGGAAGQGGGAQGDIFYRKTKNFCVPRNSEEEEEEEENQTQDPC